MSSLLTIVMAAALATVSLAQAAPVPYQDFQLHPGEGKGTIGRSVIGMICADGDGELHNSLDPKPVVSVDRNASSISTQSDFDACVEQVVRGWTEAREGNENGATHLEASEINGMIRGYNSFRAVVEDAAKRTR